MPIFSINNCFKNGVLPVILTEDEVDILFLELEATEGYELYVNLASQTVTSDSGQVFNFSLDQFRKQCLLTGLDEIGLTLIQADKLGSMRLSAKRLTLGFMEQSSSQACLIVEGCGSDFIF